VESVERLSGSVAGDGQSMKIVETPIDGVLVLETEPAADSRGSFARFWDEELLELRGLDSRMSQASVAYNAVAGTLRGLHLQVEPNREAKTVRCIRGAIFDVAVDLRDESASRFRWVGIELTGQNGRSIYVPQGCAHGYMTLVDDTEVLYLISTPHHPESARGYRWNDPAFAIDWPLPVRRISEGDARHPFIVESTS
jgi:dTDP-4-dehydrorhamnose 3,5-epimerase